MTVVKTVLIATAMLILGSCSNRKVDATDANEHIQLDMIGLQGEWRLESYRTDCLSTSFESVSNYILLFNEPDNTFGMSTDCNRIGGKFGGSNDTIRFTEVYATEMACDNMTVEEDMLRLLNDSAAYATVSGDTIFLTAPGNGEARFIRSAATSDR